MESFWETWGALGRLLEGSARSVFARVASEGSWRAIWEDFGSILGGFWLQFGSLKRTLGNKKVTCRGRSNARSKLTAGFIVAFFSVPMLNQVIWRTLELYLGGSRPQQTRVAVSASRPQQTRADISGSRPQQIRVAVSASRPPARPPRLRAEIMASSS